MFIDCTHAHSLGFFDCLRDVLRLSPSTVATIELASQARHVDAVICSTQLQNATTLVLDVPSNVTPYTPDRTAVENANLIFRQASREQHVDTSNVGITSWCS